MITGGVTTQNAAISEPVTSERMPTTSGARAVPNTVEHSAKAETLTPRACTGVTSIIAARRPGPALAAERTATECQAVPPGTIGQTRRAYRKEQRWKYGKYQG